MIEQIFFNIEIIAPIFLIIIVGLVLKLLGIIKGDFIQNTNMFVFKVSLPALLFQKVSQAGFAEVFDYKLLIIGVVVTFLQFIIGFIIAKRMKLSPEDEGVFVQGSFRSNFAILGLAVLFNLYGDDAVSKASIVLAFVMPLYNLLGVIALLMPHQNLKSINMKTITNDIILNPLVLSIIIAIPFSYKLIPLPGVIESGINYLAIIALPLALINIGATMEIQNLSRASVNAVISSFLKIIFFPALFIPFAQYFDVEGIDLIILFILFGSPTAIASYIMAGPMKGNVKLAGNIVVISTLFSVITLSFGIALLSSL